jgi:hypothetical protein
VESICGRFSDSIETEDSSERVSEVSASIDIEWMNKLYKIRKRDSGEYLEIKTIFQSQCWWIEVNRSDFNTIPDHGWVIGRDRRGQLAHISSRWV